MRENITPAPPANPQSTASANAGRTPRVGLGNGVGLLVLYLGMVFVISRLSPYFLGHRNLVNLPVSVAVLGMIAIFSTMLMIGGGLDLSVGATTALVGVAVASTQGAFGVWGATLFGLLIGLLIGMINGLLVTRVGINPLITTLGMLSTIRGLAFVFSGGLSIPMLDTNFGQLGRGNIGGLPIIVIVVMILFGGAAIVMRFSTYGRAMYAIGGANSRWRLSRAILPPPSSYTL